MNISKKIVAGVVGLSMALTALPVAGATVEELQAQINDLLAQISALQSQITDMGGSTTGVSCTFTRNLYLGVSGDDVNCLQRYLNGAGFQVAASGPGSPGNESQYYGSLTQAAVKAWQDANGVAYGAYGGYFGPLSRAKYSSLGVGEEEEEEEEEDGITTPGKEGTLTVTSGADPADAQTIYAGNTKVGVQGLKIKALGSDIRLDRIDVNFTTRPWLNISNITVSDGSTDLVTQSVTQSDTIEVTVGSSYTIRLTGFNLVIPDGVQKVLTIKVDPKLVVGDTTETLTYQILANGVRGTDGKSIQQYAPSAALTARTFTVESRTGALQLSLSADNPAERNVIGSASVVTENVELLRFNLKATVNDILVSAASTTLTNDQSAVQTLKLYDGDTLLSSVAAAATAQFTPLNLTIAKDTTKTLSIKADVKAIDGTPTEGASSSVSVATANVTAQDAATFASVTPSGSTATGKKAHFYTVAPTLALDSTSIATSRAGRVDASNTISANALIKFKVTAVGGDVYVGSTTGNAITATTTLSSAGPNTMTMTNSFTSTAVTESSAWKVPSGSTKYFEVTSFLTSASSVATFVYEYIYSVKWGTSSAAALTHTIDWSDLQTDFRTSSVYLQGTN